MGFLSAQRGGLLLGLTGCFLASDLPAAPPTGGMMLRIVPMFGAEPLTLETRAYPTPNQGAVRITTLRFYLSGLRLIYADGTIWAEPTARSYHLVDAEDSATWRLPLLGAPVGTIRFLSFSLGVDSAANVAGALGGDLDPAKGMYWAWHSGYINAKLEGTAPTCPNPKHEFAWHLGGFAAPHNSRRIITLAAPADAGSALVLRADVAAWLAAAPPLAQAENVVTVGADAMRLADAATHLFSLAPR